MIRLSFAHVLVSAGVALGVNGFVNGGRRRRSSAEKWALLPPGWVVGAVWVALFASLGYAHWLAMDRGRRLTPASLAVASVIGYCALYPWLTDGLRQSKRARMLNTLTLVIAGLLGFVTLLLPSPRAFAFVSPLFAWAAWVNIAQTYESS